MDRDVASLSRVCTRAVEIDFEVYFISEKQIRKVRAFCSIVLSVMKGFACAAGGAQGWKPWRYGEGSLLVLWGGAALSKVVFLLFQLDLYLLSWVVSGSGSRSLNFCVFEDWLLIWDIRNRIRFCKRSDLVEGTLICTWTLLGFAWNADELNHWWHVHRDSTLWLGLLTCIVLVAMSMRRVLGHESKCSFCTRFRITGM